MRTENLQANNYVPDNDLCPSYTSLIVKVNLDTGLGNENELFLWSFCDLQPMKLDCRTKEEKAIKNALLYNSIIRQEVPSTLPGTFFLA